MTRTPEDWRLQLPERRRRLLRLWLLSIAAMTFSVLIVGGVTRLTHSGLSMVEWQPIVGMIPPLDESQWLERFERYRQFPEYQQLRQGMSLQQFEAIFFWEYLHRLLARLIALVFLVPFVAFWRSGSLTGPVTRRVVAIFGLGVAQGAMGWLMVRSGLVDRPSVSHYRLAAHLRMALAIIGLSVWVARELGVRRRRTTVSVRARRGMVRGLTLIGCLTAAQVMWGAFVAGLKAGLIFGTFP
jgi:heme a synthase